MVFKINKTEAKLLWRMQKPTKPNNLYLLMDGELSKQYVFMKVRELFLRNLVTRIKTMGVTVLYKATPEGLEQAKEFLKEQSLN